MLLQLSYYGYLKHSRGKIFLETKNYVLFMWKRRKEATPYQQMRDGLEGGTVK